MCRRDGQGLHCGLLQRNLVQKREKFQRLINAKRLMNPIRLTVWSTSVKVHQSQWSGVEMACIGTA